VASGIVWVFAVGELRDGAACRRSGWRAGGRLLLSRLLSRQTLLGLRLRLWLDLRLALWLLLLVWLLLALWLVLVWLRLTLRRLLVSLGLTLGRLLVWLRLALRRLLVRLGLTIRVRLLTRLLLRLLLRLALRRLALRRSRVRLRAIRWLLRLACRLLRWLLLRITTESWVAIRLRRVLWASFGRRLLRLTRVSMGRLLWLAGMTMRRLMRLVWLMRTISCAWLRRLLAGMLLRTIRRRSGWRTGSVWDTGVSRLTVCWLIPTERLTFWTLRTRGLATSINYKLYVRAGM